MFKDGVKIYVVQLVYLIPIIFITSIFSSSFLGLISNPSPLGFFPFYLEEIIRTLFGGTPIASHLMVMGLNSFNKFISFPNNTYTLYGIGKYGKK